MCGAGSRTFIKRIMFSLIGLSIQRLVASKSGLSGLSRLSSASLSQTMALSDATFTKRIPVLSDHLDDRKERSITIRHYESKVKSSISVLFVPGFGSHGLGTKSVYLAQESTSCGFNFYCYDPEGMGESPCDFSTIEAKDWFEDCQTALELIHNERPGEPIVVVGSSMGAWIALKNYPQHSNMIRGLVLIAPALNFLWPKYQSFLSKLDNDTREKIEGGQTIVMDSEYGGLPIRKNFFVNSRMLEFDLNKPIDVECPVRILHGIKDETIPFEGSLALAKLLNSKDVDVIYRKWGDHRLSTPADLKLLSDTLASLINQIRQ